MNRLFEVVDECGDVVPGDLGPRPLDVVGCPEAQVLVPAEKFVHKLAGRQVVFEPCAGSLLVQITFHEVAEVPTAEGVAPFTHKL